MRKLDEVGFYNALRKIHGHRPYGYRAGNPLADYVGASLGIPKKRIYYILYKWCDQGMWEFGVSVRTGWFTPEAPESIL